MSVTMDGIYVDGQKAKFHPEDILTGDASAYTQEIGTAVNAWMEENVTGGEQVTDTTLTLSGVPADAKVTGDEIASLKEDLVSINNWYVPQPTYISGYFIDNTGALVANSIYSYSELIPIGRRDVLHIRLKPIVPKGAWLKLATYDGKKNFLSRYDIFYDEHLSSETKETAWINTDKNTQYVRVTYMHEDFVLYTYIDQIPYMFDVSMIPTPQIHDLPKSVVSMPTVNFSEYVQAQTGISAAKGAVYQNGEYFCVTYGENLDGTGTDIPLVSDSGCLAMKYKKFKLVNGTESNVSYGTFAQKGTSYTDYNGNTQEFIGGVGLPSGVENRQYFTSAYTVEDTQGMNYTFAGRSNYGMTPCCCDVNVDSDGAVTFGDIKELSLTVNNEKGKFDLHRIDASYWMTSYLTTTPPCHDLEGWKWLQGVNNGIAYFTSNNGIDWTYVFTIPVPFQPKCEITGTYKNGYMYFACRTNPSFKLFTDALFVGKINVEHGYISLIYQLPFVESRAFITKIGSDVMLFYSPADKGIVDCIRITEFDNYEFYFWRWFTIYKNCTWYISPVFDNGKVNIYPENIVNGKFFDDHGTIYDNVDYCYIADYIPVEQGDKIYADMMSDRNMVFWTKVCLYDANKAFINRQDIPTSSTPSKSASGYTTINNANCKYIRITYKNMLSDASYNVRFRAYVQQADFISDNTIKSINAVGGIGAVGSTAGLQFMQMTFDTSKPYRPSDISAMVL